MLLGQIRDYVKHRGTVSLYDVAVHFDISEDTARFALDYWQQKRVIQATTGGCGSSCQSCSTAAISYQWGQQSVPIRWV